MKLAEIWNEKYQKLNFLLIFPQNFHCIDIANCTIMYKNKNIEFFLI